VVHPFVLTRRLHRTQVNTGIFVVCYLLPPPTTRSRRHATRRSYEDRNRFSLSLTAVGSTRDTSLFVSVTSLNGPPRERACSSESFYVTAKSELHIKRRIAISPLNGGLGYTKWMIIHQHIRRTSSKPHPMFFTPYSFSLRENERVFITLLTTAQLLARTFEKSAITH
jgi:hypothetical protein